MQNQIQDILNTTGLNWEVSKQKLLTESGIAIDSKVALIRSDNNAVLGVMGDTYEAYQNAELLELLFQISRSTGLELHGGGSFGAGEKIFYQLKSDDMILGSDKIEGFITGVNSHDGSTALGFGNSTLTISCMNTFFKASKQLDSKIRHSVNLRPRIDAILKSLDILLKDEQDDFKTIKKMSEIQITPQIKDTVIRTLFQLSPIDKIGELSTRKDNQILAFGTDWDREIAQKGDNLWGAMSAATRYSTHTQFKTAEKGQLQKMFGRAGENERLVWGKLAKLVA